MYEYYNIQKYVYGNDNIYIYIKNITYVELSTVAEYSNISTKYIQKCMDTTDKIRKHDIYAYTSRNDLYIKR